MLLHFSNGEFFATGAMEYAYIPATIWETTPRITIDVQIGQFRTSAFVDTGGVYLLCTAEIAASLQLSDQESLGSSELLVRGRKLKGNLFRIPVTFPATVGQPLTIDALALIPQAEDGWEIEIPCILGMSGCLERLRFAVDPLTDKFYFGEMVNNL